MRNKKAQILGVAGGLMLTVSAAAWARITQEEAAQLGLTGTPLTPVGAERAGNADGPFPEHYEPLECPIQENPLNKNYRINAENFTRLVDHFFFFTGNMWDQVALDIHR